MNRTPEQELAALVLDMAARIERLENQLDRVQDRLVLFRCRLEDCPCQQPDVR
jgi:hypothetical protein